jgi:hypothetical protein
VLALQDVDVVQDADVLQDVDALPHAVLPALNRADRWRRNLL